MVLRWYHVRSFIPMLQDHFASLLEAIADNGPKVAETSSSCDAADLTSSRFASATFRRHDGKFVYMDRQGGYITERAAAYALSGRLLFGTLVEERGRRHGVRLYGFESALRVGAAL